MNPVMDSDVTPIDPKPFEILTYLSGKYIGEMIEYPYFNRTSQSSISLHKRQANPRDTFTEAVEFWHRHSKIVRLIL